MMRTTAMQVAIMVTEIERIIVTIEHMDEGSANPPLAAESPPHARAMNTVQSTSPCSIQSKTVAQR